MAAIVDKSLTKLMRVRSMDFSCKKYCKERSLLSSVHVAFNHHLLVSKDILAFTQTTRKMNPRVLGALSTQDCTSFSPVDFKKLQNGSDIRGIALEGVEGEAVNLTEPATEAIAAGFVKFLKGNCGGDMTRPLVISVGHDSRTSTESMLSAVSRGLVSEGAQVVIYGLASTPAMFNSTIVNDPQLFCPSDGAIMITASHLPFNRNGMKFFTSQGGASKADISVILSHAAEAYSAMTVDSVSANQKKAEEVTKKVDFMKRYSADLVAAVRKGANGAERPLEGFRIIVDAGNGAGGFFAASVLEPLGANTEGSQFLNPDGTFPNHIPNPEDKKAMDMITQAVKDTKADLGIIFDTDVDRAAAVDSNGVELNRNRLIALMAALVLQEHPGSTVVTDSVTSDGLTSFIEKLGGKHHRFKRGYKNVIDEGIRLNKVGEECHLAIETSGHGALLENNWLDDGAYLMVKLLIRLASAATAGQKGGSSVLTDLIAELKEAEFAAELRFKIDQEHSEVSEGGFRAYGERVLEALDKEVDERSDLVKAPVNNEGIRVSGYGGWFLLRLSLHDPVLPLNIESPDAESAKKLGEAVLRVVQKFKALDISALEKLLAA